MSHLIIRPPPGLIQVKAIFFETCQVYDTRIRTTCSVVRCGLTQIIPPRPYKFPGYVRMLVLGSKNFIGGCTKLGSVQFVTAYILPFRIATGTIARRCTYAAGN